MDIIISKTGGDISEFRRVSRFMRTTLNPNAYFYASHVSVHHIFGLTDDEDPVFDYPWHKAKTREKRRMYLDAYTETPTPSHFGSSVPFPIEYCVALYEDELKDIYYEAALIIQRHVRGVLTRNVCGMYNPHCEFGRRFITRMFENT
jgi:hypothetical protein